MTPICSACHALPAAALLGLSVCLMCQEQIAPDSGHDELAVVLTLPGLEVLLEVAKDALDSAQIFQRALNAAEQHHLDMAVTRLGWALADYTTHEEETA